ALLLAGAGVLRGVNATTHWGALDDLARLGANPIRERVVRSGKIVTAAGVSAGIARTGSSSSWSFPTCRGSSPQTAGGADEGHLFSVQLRCVCPRHQRSIPTRCASRSPRRPTAVAPS